METILGILALAVTVVGSAISFAWWLSRHLTKIEGWFKSNETSHERIEQSVTEVKKEVEAFASDQRECREKLVNIDTKVKILCGGGDEDEDG